MTSRRKFIKQSFLSGWMLYKGPRFWLPAADGRFNFLSKHLKIGLDPHYPKLTSFDIDGLGQSQFGIDPLLTNYLQPRENEYLSRVKGNVIAYYLKGYEKKPAWEIKCEEKKIIVITNYTGAADKPAPLPIVIAQQINHCTVLGKMTAENLLSFPSLLHLPGRGSLKIECDRPDVNLFYDAYRYHLKNEKGDPFVKLEFSAADSEKPSITYTLEVTCIYPDIKEIRHLPVFDGLKRNFINIFQLNPRIKVLANNSASDACTFTLFLYAEMARNTPKLAKGLSAIDLIKSSAEVYLDGFKGYGQVGNKQSYGWQSKYDSSDSAPSLIISACYYIQESKDNTWAEAHYDGIKSWADKMIQTDTNQDGIIEYGYSGNSGSWDDKDFKRPANWWDTIGFGYEDAYSNALAYQAVKVLSAVALSLNKTSDSKYFSLFADKLKGNYFDHFFNKDTGVLAGWRSEDGRLHDYYFTFVNSVAVTYGLLTKEQGKLVMGNLLQKMKAVGFTDFTLGLPGNLVPVRSEDYVHHVKRWGYGEKPDGSDGFQIYENGGATGCFAYFTIKALYRIDMHNEADEIFLAMMQSFKTGGFEGHCEESTYTKDWKAWDGTCWGYEGFLVDNYLPLLAVFDWASAAN